MRVTQAFGPITVVFETPEEAEAVRCILIEGRAHGFGGGERCQAADRLADALTVALLETAR